MAAEPRELEGVTWVAVSPRLITVRLLLSALVLVPVLAAAVVVAAVTGVVWLWAIPVVVLGVCGWVTWLVPRQVRAMGYAERADDVLLRRGLMFRSLVVVPYGRMQYVDVTAGPLARRFGLVTVQMHTASPDSGFTVDGLPTAEAARLRDQLTARGQARLAGL